MTDKMLISAHELFERHPSERCLIVDCRFNLGNPKAGYQAYLESHIPTAVYADLDKDLASPVTSVSGRHPLPEPASFAVFLQRIGWKPDIDLVAYDDIGGAFAARLWWLMKYFGYDRVRLLDGGYPAWLKAGYATSVGDADMSVEPAPLTPLAANEDMVLTAADVENGLAQNAIVLVDARAPERYSGEVEPLDAVAGHVPGAKNLPLSLNLDQGQKFKSQESLRGQWQTMLTDSGSRQLVHMCGSGVTACFNQFAAELAGFEGSKVYTGSWSEWIRDPTRGIAPG